MASLWRDMLSIRTTLAIVDNAHMLVIWLPASVMLSSRWSGVWHTTQPGIGMVATAN